MLWQHRAFVESEIVLSPLRSLTRPAILCLLNEDLYEITIELLADVLLHFSNFFLDEDFKLLYTILSSPWAQERYNKLVEGDFDFDSLQFGQFMLNFGDATVQDLAQKAELDEQSQQILSALCGLLGAKGFAVNEDRIFDRALEFWSTFVETLLDFSYQSDEEQPSWFAVAKSYVMQAIEKSWCKIQFPPAKEFSLWDSVERTGFKDIRRDVKDLLTQSYLIIGKELFSLFADLALRSLGKEEVAWAEVEASLYCLSAFSDYANGGECDGYLDLVFGSPLFYVLSNSGTVVPARVRQTFLALIDNYSGYFERHTQHVPSALNLMFSMLGSPSLAKTASKSILTMCSSCRKLLVPEIGAFLEQYTKIIQLSSIDSFVKEGVTGAVASIIQAIPDEASKVAPVGNLLNYVQIDHERSLRLLNMSSFSKPPENPAEAYAAASELMVSCLRCLSSIAKGLRAPNDVPLDLESSPTNSPCWTAGEGVIVQMRILDMIMTACEIFSNNGEVVEAACGVFRTGLTEHEPGPFVFTPDDVTKFLLKADLKTPRLVVVISTACSLISSHAAASARNIDEIAAALLVWICGILRALEGASFDHGLTGGMLN